MTALPLDKSRVILPGILALTHRHNPGAAFSLWPQMPPVVLLSLNVLVLGVFVALIWPCLAQRAGVAAAILVLGGAIGNIIDRFSRHFVIDYLDFHVWPVFNLADTCVVVGVAILVWQLLRPAPAEPAEGETA